MQRRKVGGALSVRLLRRHFVRNVKKRLWKKNADEVGWTKGERLSGLHIRALGRGEERVQNKKQKEK